MPTAIYHEQVTDAMAWTGDDFNSKEDFCFDLSSRNVAALESILRRTSQWDSLLELYDEQAQVAPSDEERVALLEKTALVLRDQKDDPDRAIEALREVVAIDAGHAGATAALDALLTSRERWSDLADHLRHQLDLATDPATLAELKHRLAVL